ncbi:DUF2625 domain-containing protein [Prosthecobacter algae]|uniref:DUF2625 domain-containing protein n=2 Tax=Prosthecobacter algae TaxID=1144682 RepID=A0ABP9PC68_9BACT
MYGMAMRPLSELINDEDSAISFVRTTALAEPGRCVVHPPSEFAADVLYHTQVTTRSPMGAIAYHTGGISILDGWLRILGSGSAAIPRSLSGWNTGRSDGFHLFADDAFGGFFALDGGALGPGKGDVFYFAPRSLEWEPLDCSYTQFFTWACTDFRGFYDDVIWSGCETVIADMKPDRCFFFYPPLWTAERVLPPIDIRDIPVAEVWGYQMEMRLQLASQEASCE